MPIFSFQVLVPTARMENSKILSQVGGCAWLIRRGLEWIYWLLIHSTRDYSATAIFTLYSSPLHTQYVSSQSSLVVSWQRFYNSLTVTSNHTWSLLFPSCHYSATANSEESIRFNSIHLLPSSYSGRLESRNSKGSSELFFITTSKAQRRKHSFSIVGKACLQRRCITAEVTRLLLAYSLLRKCV
jgi:hypothetical protein